MCLNQCTASKQTESREGSTPESIPLLGPTEHKDANARGYNFSQFKPWLKREKCSMHMHMHMHTPTNPHTHTHPTHTEQTTKAINLQASGIQNKTATARPRVNHAPRHPPCHWQAMQWNHFC
jgi:hypothetical protein